MPRGVFDPYFVNPLISVMPRVVFALVAWSLTRVAIKISKNHPGLTDLLFFIVILISSLVHGILVLTMLGLFMTENIWKFIGAIVSINSTVELIMALIALPFIYKRVKNSSTLIDYKY
jgi:hypothetical protein